MWCRSGTSGCRLRVRLGLLWVARCVCCGRARADCRVRRAGRVVCCRDYRVRGGGAEVSGGVVSLVCAYAAELSRATARDAAETGLPGALGRSFREPGMLVGAGDASHECLAERFPPSAVEVTDGRYGNGWT